MIAFDVNHLLLAQTRSDKGWRVAERCFHGPIHRSLYTDADDA